MVARADRGAEPSDRRPVGVLALQGSFALHARCLERLGAASRLVRRAEDLDGVSALILPGGESTTQSLLARQDGLFDVLREKALRGLPMFGTCAGAILLGRGDGIPRRLEAAPVWLVRNAYGTQIDSFTASLRLEPFSEPFRGIFIRAPKIVRWEGGAEVLGEWGGSPVLVAWERVLLATFHPELTEDLRVHEYFLRRFVDAPEAATARLLAAG